MSECKVPPKGWYCTREGGHDGPCAAWSLVGVVGEPVKIPWYRRPTLVNKTPLVSVALLEAANCQQLYRMWTEHTAAGQSLTAWVSVNIACWLWLNFYLTFNRENKFAIWGTALGLVLNGFIILSVIYFQYFA